MKVFDKYIFTMTNNGDVYVLDDKNNTMSIIKKISYRSDCDGCEKFTGFISSTLIQPNNKDGLSIITIRTTSKRENSYIFNKYIHRSFISVIPILTLYDDESVVMNLLRNGIERIIKEDNNNRYTSRQDIIWYLKRLNNEEKTKEIIQYLLNINDLSSLRFAYYISKIFGTNDVNINDLILANILYRFDNYLKLPKEKQIFYREFIQRMLYICDLQKYEDDKILNMKTIVHLAEQCSLVDKCPYCDVDVPLTQFSDFSCSNLHPLVRCLNSFKILSECDGYVCSICGTEYNNVNNNELENWLGNVKNENVFVCMLCGNILKKDV